MSSSHAQTLGIQHSVGDLGASNKERKALDYMAGGQRITVLGEREFMQLLTSARISDLVLPSALVDSSDFLAPSPRPRL